MNIFTVFLFAIFLGACVAIPTKTARTVKPVLDRLEKEVDAEHAKVLKQNDITALNKSLNEFRVQFDKAKTNYDNFQKKYNTADKGLKEHMLEYQDEKHLIQSLYSFIKVYSNEDHWIHLNCQCNSSKIYKF